MEEQTNGQRQLLSRFLTENTQKQKGNKGLKWLNTFHFTPSHLKMHFNTLELTPATICFVIFIFESFPQFFGALVGAVSPIREMEFV